MIKFRFASYKDIQKLKEINPTLSQQIIEGRLEEQKLKKEEYIIAHDGDKIIGYVLLKWNGKPTHPDYPDMEDLYMAKEERGKGYGKLLISECERRIKAKGHSKAGMAVNPSDFCPAKRLYVKMGYKHDGKKEYTDGIYDNTPVKVIDMEKVI